MIPREEAARFIEHQMSNDYEQSREKNDRTHYGNQELRELLDFIYQYTPTTGKDMLKNVNTRKEKIYK